MDIYALQDLQPESHYENIVLKKDSHSFIQQVKYIAFSYMEQLEGWCTKNKASILIDLVFMTRPDTIVEIGVWGGKSLVPMAYSLKALRNGRIYGVDPWNSVESADGMEGVNYDWWRSVDHEKILQGLQIKITEFGLQEQIELIRSTSEEAPVIPNIDMLHIDGNHSEKASNLDVRKWVPLVRTGGIIIFDDVTWGTNASAVQWLDENCIKLAEFHEDNDWAIWIKQ